MSNSMSNTPQYLTETQVAERTGFALSTLRNHRFQRMGIPYLKIGKRSVRYRLDDVIAYMEQNRIHFDESGE